MIASAWAQEEADFQACLHQVHPPVALMHDARQNCAGRAQAGRKFICFRGEDARRKMVLSTRPIGAPACSTSGMEDRAPPFFFPSTLITVPTDRRSPPP